MGKVRYLPLQRIAFRCYGLENVFLFRKSRGPFIPDWLKDAYWENEVPRVVFKFAEGDVLMSGMLRGEREIAGTPAVIDAPVGAGHVVLFANRPFRRWQTRGNHALVFNAMLHWNDLRAGWPSRPGEEEGQAVTDDGGPDG